jgi:hypothetical protein
MRVALDGSTLVVRKVVPENHIAEVGIATQDHP